MAFHSCALLAACLLLLVHSAVCFKADDGYQPVDAPRHRDLLAHRHKRQAAAPTCSGQEYNGTTHRCCQGSIVGVPKSLSKASTEDVARYGWCCASSSYDIRTSLCCAGSLRPDVVPSKLERSHYRCCGSDSIDIRKLACCGSAGLPLGDVPAAQAQCCGGALFNNMTLGCCAGATFNKKTQLCCDGAVTLEGGVDTHLCCGPTSFSLEDIKNRGLLCCKGEVYENAGDAKCCGHTMYEPNNEEGCCANEIYSTTTDLCCQGRELRVGYPETEFECCAYGVIHRSSETMCCDRTIVRGRPGTGHACCGRESYKIDAQVCCGPAGGKKVMFGTDCAYAKRNHKRYPDPALMFLW